MVLTDETLSELERLDREATPGPWSNGAAYGARVVDAHIISAARNVLPELVAEVRRLRDARAVLEGTNDCLTRERDEARRDAAHWLNQYESAAASLAAQPEHIAHARREGAEEMRRAAVLVLAIYVAGNDDAKALIQHVRALPLLEDDR